MWDPAKKKYIFDMNDQHELMIREWRKVFDKHKDNPPSWDNFLRDYGRYQQHNGDCPKTLPNAKMLHQRAKKAEQDTVPGPDGWRPRELKLLPLIAWEQRILVLQLSAELAKSPKAYYTVITPALTKKGKGRAPLDHRLLAVFSAPLPYRSGSMV